MIDIDKLIKPSDFMQHLDITSPGRSVFLGLKSTLDELFRTAPEDHDVLVIAHDILVRNVRLRDDDTILFEGVDDNGHRSVVFIHYTQIVARVVVRPKLQGASRVITGFAPVTPPE